MGLRFGNLLTGLAAAAVWLGNSPAALAQDADPVIARAAPRALRVKLAYSDDGSSSAVSRLVTRLNAELRVAGFDVEAVPVEHAGADEQASAEALQEGYAVVVVELKAERLNLDITTRSLDTSSHVVLTGLDREVPALAIQVTEFLRAGLIPRAQPRVAEPTPPPPPVPAPARVAEPSGAFWLDTGASLLTNVGAADRLVLLSLGAGYRWPSGVSVGLEADIPILGGTFDAPAGVADYRLWQGLLHADYAWLTWPHGEASLGVCGGLALVTATGRGDDMSRALRSELWALSLGARLAARFDLSERFAIVGSVRALGLSPQPYIVVLDAERRLGGPTLIFELGWRVGRNR